MALNHPIIEKYLPKYKGDRDTLNFFLDQVIMKTRGAKRASNLNINHLVNDHLPYITIHEWGGKFLLDTGITRSLIKPSHIKKNRDKQNFKKRIYHKNGS